MKSRRKVTSVHSEYLLRRNKKIFQMRRNGKPLKEIAYDFNLTIRQISRIIDEISGK